MVIIDHLNSYLSNSSSRSIGIIFSINSFMFGNWVARIPEVKQRLSLTDAELGLALLGVSIGAVICMPFSNFLIQRFGPGRLSIWFIILYCLFMILPVVATSFTSLVIGLFLVGAANGIVDIVMNATAASIEKLENVSIMSTTHGMWSLGGMIGSALSGFIAQAGISQPIHMAVLAFVMIILGYMQKSNLVSLVDPSQEKSGFALPRGPIIGLALMAFCILIAEGGIADWSAVYISDITSGDKIETALGYTGFSLAMTLGRFFGDIIIPKYRRHSILMTCALIAMVGISLPTVYIHPWVSVLGFTICGFGYSLIVPIIISAAASIKGIAPGTAITMVATLGYAGFLVGPPSIGFISETLNLQAGLWFLTLLTSVVLIYSLKVKFSNNGY